MSDFLIANAIWALVVIRVAVMAERIVQNVNVSVKDETTVDVTTKKMP